MSTSTRRYGGLTPDERDAGRRQRVLDACRELIGEHGYAATTVERICSTASVSTRHFYQHYDNKEAAFIELYETITSASYAAAAEQLAVTEGRPFLDRIPPTFLAYLSPMVHDVRTARIAFVEIMGVSARLEARRLEFRESLVALIEREGSEAVARGEITDRDFRFAALALAGAATAVVYDWTIRDDRPSVAAIEGALTDLAVTLIAG
ncbi:TetR/AcrR family transcriptional regulator [Aeromicrobium sp.]|uniref:TetR/AcrR family transcriptional regulator n=1 Tax=Aeromicrobium sp. TaxID=1871063 RepID=UPI0030C09DB4